VLTMYNDLNSPTVLQESEINKKKSSTRNQIHTLNDVVYDITFKKEQKLKIQTQRPSRQTMEYTEQTYKTYVTGGYDVTISRNRLSSAKILPSILDW
jgi:hypothetical protein